MVVRAVVCLVAETAGVDAPAASMLEFALSAREVASGTELYPLQKSGGPLLDFPLAGVGPLPRFPPLWPWPALG